MIKVRLHLEVPTHSLCTMCSRRGNPLTPPPSPFLAEFQNPSWVPSCEFLWNLLNFLCPLAVAKFTFVKKSSNFDLNFLIQLKIRIKLIFTIFSCVQVSTGLLVLLVLMLVKVVEPFLGPAWDSLSCGCGCQFYDVGTCETRFTTKCEVSSYIGRVSWVGVSGGGIKEMSIGFYLIIFLNKQIFSRLKNEKLIHPFFLQACVIFYWIYFGFGELLKLGNLSSCGDCFNDWLICDQRN